MHQRHADALLRRRRRFRVHAYFAAAFDADYFFAR